MPTIVLNAKDDATVTMEKVTFSWKRMEAAGTSASGNISKGFQRMANRAEADAGSMAATIGSIFAGLGVGLSAGALVGFLKEGIEKAREAEGVFTQLRFAVNAATDDGFGRYAAAVQSATAATARYAIVQEEVANKALQILVTNTGKLTESLDNLNLVFDLASAKHLDLASAAQIVSLAMEGNVTALRKQLPEFSELLDDLDKHADRSEKSALAVRFLHDKLDGATGEMSAHERGVKEIHKAWDDFWQDAGSIGLTTFDRVKTAITDTTREIYFMLPATVLLGEQVDQASVALQIHEARLRGAEVAAARAALASADLAKKELEQAQAEAELQAVMDHLNESGRERGELDQFDIEMKTKREAATKALTKALSEQEQQIKKLRALEQAMATEAENVFLTRGGPEDALRRIRQTAFSGPTQSVASLQNLLSTTQGVKGAEPGDLERLLRDLTEQLRLQVGTELGTAQSSVGRTQRAGAAATQDITVFLGSRELVTVSRDLEGQARADFLTQLGAE
jgi:hypothetical protein